MKTRIAPALAAALACGLWAAAATAHDDHDHGDEARSAPAAEAPRGTSRSGALELVAVARDGTLTVFLDRADTNEPVTDAAIEVEVTGGEGAGGEAAGVKAAAAPAADGSYRLDAHWSETPGDHHVLFTVATRGVTEVLPVTLTVPPQPVPAAAPAPWHAGLAVAHDFGTHLRNADPMPLLIGGAGFLLGVAASVLMRGRRSAAALALLVLAVGLLAAPIAFAHGDDDHGDDDRGGAAASMPTAALGAQDLAQRLPDGAVFVPKPTQRILSVRTVVTASDVLSRTTELPGRIIADPNGSGVVQSSVGGRLSPAESGLFPHLGTRVRKGEVLAFVTPPVQAVDVSDMRQRQGELDQQIAIVERRVDRYRKLASGGSVSQVQLEEALAELRGLGDRRSALDGVRLQPEALAAPVSGVVAEANAVAGQMASPGAMVFRIVDPARLWVEALSFDAAAGTGDATARLADGRRLDLTYMGAGLADRSQAVPIQFAVRDGPAELRTGQFVTVLAAADARQTGLALPRLSVVRGGNGQTIVYEHTGAERFEPREVRVEPLDAARVLVVSGLEPGRRIVTQGAELLNQIR